MSNKLTSSVLDLIKAYIASGIFPGASFAIVSDDVVTKYALGNRQIKPETHPLMPNERYDLASVSKVVGTGTVVLDLILAGSLSLDSLLTDYYPEFMGGAVTIRQLMTHTSGIDPFIKGRNEMDAVQLRAALNQVNVTSDKSFHYSDVNFILLGFMLETIFSQSLDVILSERIFVPFGMTHTSFSGEGAVPTAWELPRGLVHDPKAQVLGVHTGSAGLFSDLDDLAKFCQGYFSEARYLSLLSDFTLEDGKRRSLAWDIYDNVENTENSEISWLLHTGYTGTFILLNLRTKEAVIFLSNRVHLRDERQKWIAERDRLIQAFVAMFEK
ncbi:serine hydrolase domain-containing protein [Lactococcus insecticola]|uniref:Serine hydrolase n=1 Tax=Pseudolactococcus insecticola TaxID=2709158 RepID=A0A6A0B6N8_9LACT|nr:serine hydrolase domain-containing protein [Lactococcus insecticola]GFH40606.1 serine hydrolase [Lactococcus insecticola]